MNKEVRKFIARVNNVPGVEVTEGKTHLRVMKDGRMVATLPKTPSDHRWMDNALRDLRRQGITPRAETKAPPTVKPPRDPESIRASLRHLWDTGVRGEKMQLARFVQQYGEANGLKTYASVEAAQVGLGSFASGKIKKPAEHILFLLEHSLPHYHRVSKVVEEEVESPKVEDPNTIITLTIDLETVTELAARLGIRLEVK